MITIQASIDCLFEPDCRIVDYYPPGHEHYPLIVRDFAKGCVLDTYERNGYDDSDFFATYWNEETQAVDCIEYGTTRAWTYANSAQVDYTPEVEAKAREYYRLKLVAQLARNDAEECAEVGKGKVCEVVKGRKIPKGEIVKVLGAPQGATYGYNTVVYSVLVSSPSKGSLKTNIENLRVINPEAYAKPSGEIEAEAARIAMHTNWRSMPYAGMSKRLSAALARVMR